jgi:hypothetical protein
MNRLLFLFFLLLSAKVSSSAVLKGRITDVSGEPLPFASLYIKGTTKGVTTNAAGYYTLELPNGGHTVVAQYVGFQKQEVAVEMKNIEQVKNIVLKPVETSLKELVINANENLALKIIRKAIKKRSVYNKQVKKYKADAYVKTVVRFDETPSSSSGVVFSVGDSKKKKDSSDAVELENMKGIQYLAETLNELYFMQPNKQKIVVKSSQISGSQGGYGLSQPLSINVYDNTMQVSEQITPRGIISPIAELAPLSYNYEMIGAYQDGNQLIHRIKLSPKRKQEPVLSGIIEIVDQEWRMQSLDAWLSADQGIEFMDSIHLRMITIPVGSYHMIKDQSMQFKLKIFGFKLTGDLVNVFTNYDFDYDPKLIFDKFEREYREDALSKSRTQWDSLRPVPLAVEEKNNYHKKDSLTAVQDSKSDSIAKKIKLRHVVFGGLKLGRKKSTLESSSFFNLYNWNWNTVEGLNYRFRIKHTYRFDKFSWMKNTLNLRYGFSNQQPNLVYSGTYRFGKTNVSKVMWSAGREVRQFNNAEPVNELLNSAYTLLEGRNYYKMYQAWVGCLAYRYKLVRGLSVEAKLEYQSRQMLANSNMFRLSKKNYLTENYPVEQLNQFEPDHRALLANLEIQYQPGVKLIRYPDRIAAAESSLPVFTMQFTKGIKMDAIQASTDFAKWQLNMQDQLQLNLWGEFKYRLGIGGFLQNKKTYLADYTHFNGGQILLASPYVQSFQLSPYYLNSNTEAFYSVGHAEHHFNGLLTNKIPLFKKLKWHLVGASNAYYVNSNTNYIEVSAGLENIGYRLFRFLRVDAVAGYTNFKNPVWGVRVGLVGIVGNSLMQSKDDD